MKLSLPKSPISIITVVLATLVAVGLLYVFFWRTPDSSYQAANERLSRMTASSTTISKKVADIQYSVDIDESLVAELVQAAEQYNTNLKSLSENTAAKRDHSVKAYYDQHSGALRAYGQSTTDLAASLDKYRAILITCSVLIDRLDTLTTTSAFDTAAAECNSAIGAAEKAAKSPFTVAFLDRYVVLSSDFLTAYRNQVAVANNNVAKTAAANEITRVKQAISTHSDTELDLTLNAPTATFKDLGDIITTQSKAFLR